MSDVTLLRESVESLAGGRPSPDFAELETRATRRGRRRLVLVAATAAAVVATSVVAFTDRGHHSRRVAPIGPPIVSASKIIANGHLYAYAGNKSGLVLTVWTTCSSELDTRCGHAWRLGRGAQQVAAGVISQGKSHAYVQVSAGKTGFLIAKPIENILHVGLDGTTTASACVAPDPVLRPGRLLWDGSAHDTAGVFCPTRFGAGDNEHYQGIEARPVAAGAFTADGRLWALVDNSDYGPPLALTIGMFDGHRWHYRDLASGASAGCSVAAVGSTIVVLTPAGMFVSTDDGAHWHEITDLPMPKPRMSDPSAPSIAFAGPSTLYIGDSRGGLWRSTDLAAFQPIDVPGGMHSLTPAGDDLLALSNDDVGLFRITADGHVQRLTVR